MMPSHPQWADLKLIHELQQLGQHASCVIRRLEHVIQWRGRPAALFNRTIRYEWLALYLFDDLAEVQGFVR
jgi:hypothetical protein